MMLNFIIYFLSLSLKLTTVISQNVFPNHLDFQKIGEVLIKDQKYNILRPSTHTVRDHFQDAMMRRDTAEFPTKRLFIDKNGFRHFWSGFDENLKSLRKTDLPQNFFAKAGREIIDYNNPTNNVNFDFTNDSEEATKRTDKATNKNNTKDKTVKAQVENEELENNKRQIESSETVNQKAVTAVASSSVEEAPKRRTAAHSLPRQTEDPNLLRGGDKEKIAVITSFFCPFFGVIKMTSYVDAL